MSPKQTTQGCLTYGVPFKYAQDGAEATSHPGINKLLQALTVCCGPVWLTDMPFDLLALESRETAQCCIGLGVARGKKSADPRRSRRAQKEEFRRGLSVRAMREMCEGRAEREDGLACSLQGGILCRRRRTAS